MDLYSHDKPRETREALLRRVVVFALHQFMGAFGVLVLCPWVLNLFADVVRPLGWTIYTDQVHWLLIGTPYYPVQIVVALLLGRFFGLYYRHRSAPWVWVAPLALLCARFATFSPSHMSIMESAGFDLSLRFSHLFGWACRAQGSCHDQVVATLPFYSATAYSLGAFAALKAARVPKYVDFMKTLNKKRAVLFIGLPALCWSCLTITPRVHWQSWVQVPVYLVTVSIESTVITCFFLLVVSLIGRRSFLNRSG